jgi:hypothetical protein
MVEGANEYRMEKEHIKLKQRQIEIEKFTRNPHKWDDKPMIDPSIAPVLASKERIKPASRIQNIMMSKRR